MLNKAQPNPSDYISLRMRDGLGSRPATWTAAAAATGAAAAAAAAANCLLHKFFLVITNTHTRVASV